MEMGQNLVPLVNIKIAGKWMFIPLKMVCIGIDPYPYYPPNMEYGPKRTCGLASKTWRDKPNDTKCTFSVG